MNGQPPAADPSNLTVHDPDPPHATAGGSSEPWHPKLTVHRALIISLTTGFGLAKAILSYRGKSVAPTTIEWVFGVVVTLLLYWLELHENTNPHVAPWFFENDLAPPIWKLLALIKCKPNYRTEERVLTMLVQKPHPPITGYQLLLSVVVMTFGLAKAILAYAGKRTASTSVDWVLGVVLTLAFYWLGLYERSSPQVLAVLFETDYTSTVQKVFLGSIKGGFHGGILFLHILALVLASGWTHIWVTGLHALWTSKMEVTSSFDRVFSWTFSILWSMGACAAIGFGTAACLTILSSVVRYLWSILEPTCLCWEGQVSDGIDVEEPPIRWSWLALPRLPILDGFMMGSVATVLKNVIIVLVYIIGHAVALLVCFGWSFMWLYGLVKLWERILHLDDTGVFWRLFMMSFALVWSVGGCGAIGVGLYGCFTVIGLFLSYLFGRSNVGYSPLTDF